MIAWIARKFKALRRRTPIWLADHSYIIHHCNTRIRESRLRRLSYPATRAQRAFSGDRLAIWMVDPRDGQSGGWADRLRGILSTWALCKQTGTRFGIWFKRPFALEEYLLPAAYDWRLREEELDREHARPLCYCGADAAHKRVPSIRYGVHHLRRGIARNAVSHVYSNMWPRREEFPLLYHELFRPAPRLEALIEQQAEAIGGSYVAVAFRFVQLLGDFKDGVASFPILPEAQREGLIVHCLEQLEQVRAENPQVKRVLVTADSSTFLARAAAEFDWVYVVAGDVAHIDALQYTAEQTTLKLFLDFYLLTRAQRVCLLVGPGMYRSGFSRTAARVGNVPFEQRIFR